MLKSTIVLSAVLLGTQQDGTTELLRMQGAQGRDWQTEYIYLENDASVRIHAWNHTVDAINGNRAGVRILVNGNVVASVWLDQVDASTDYAFHGMGPLRVYAICSNTHATASECGLRITQEAPRIIPGH